MRQNIAAALFCAVVVCMTSVIVLAEEPTPIQRLMDLSGLTVQTTQTVDHSRNGVLVSLAQAGVSQSTIEAMKPRVIDVLRPETFLAAIESELQTSLTLGEIEELLAWFESDVSKKITEAEKSAGTLEAQLDMLLQSETLVQDAERVAFVRELLDQIQGTEFAVAQARNLTLLTTASLWGIQRPDEPFNLPAVRVYLRGYEQAIREEIEELTTLLYLYAYRDIDLAELEQYLALLSTPHASKLQEALIRAMDQQFELAALALAERTAAPIGGRTPTFGGGAS